MIIAEKTLFVTVMVCLALGVTSTAMPKALGNVVGGICISIIWLCGVYDYLVYGCRWIIWLRERRDKAVRT